MNESFVNMRTLLHEQQPRIIILSADTTDILTAEYATSRSSSEIDKSPYDGITTFPTSTMVRGTDVVISTDSAFMGIGDYSDGKKMNSVLFYRADIKINITVYRQCLCTLFVKHNLFG